MANTIDLDNFTKLFEQMNMMTNYLKKLEKQNNILFKKVENIEKYIAGNCNNENRSNFTAAKQKKMNIENKNLDTEKEDESEIEKNNKKNKKCNKKDQIKDLSTHEDPFLKLINNKDPIKETSKSVKNDDSINKSIQKTPKDQAEIEIIPVITEVKPDENDNKSDENDNKSDENKIKSDESENESDENDNKSDENKIKSDDTEIKPAEPISAKESKAPRNHNKKNGKKMKINKGFKIGFLGEAYVYEDLHQLGCFSNIRWNALSKDEHNPSVTLNNGHKYYIHGDGEHYDILATDKGGKSYYIEIKATAKSERSNHIKPKQEQLRANLSCNVRHFVLAKVKNVLSNPEIEYYIFNPSTQYRMIDVNSEHTDKYFIKRLFENKEYAIVPKANNIEIVKPDMKSNKKNQK